MSNVPKLRFKEFSGEWEENTLKELSKLITKGTTPKKFDENGITFVKIEGISNLKINKEKCLFISESVHNGDLKRSKLEENDILFAIAGSLGKVALVTADILPANTNQALSIIRLKDKDYLRYITLVLQSQRMKKYVYQNLSVGAQPNLSLEQVGNFSLCLPSKQEQEQIASFLTSVDGKIEQLTKKEELLSSYKKGVMQKIFSGEIRFKADDSECPEWEEKKLDNILTQLTNGLSLTQNTENKGYKVSRIETISDANININKVGYVETDKDISDYKLQFGDMLFSNINSVKHIGKIAFVDKKYDLYHGMNLLKLRVNNNNNPRYIYYVLTSRKYKNYFETICNQAVSQASINQTDLKKIKLKLPSLEEQTKIANFLSSIDSKIEQVKKQLVFTKEFKQALIQQMFV